MAYSTPIDPTLIIGDHNFKDHVKKIVSEGCSQTGFIERDWTKQPLCSINGTHPVPSELLYDKKQLVEIFTEQQSNGTSLRQIIDSWNYRGWLKQYNTNYCWCYAVIHALMIIRGLANLPMVRLSPYSVACIIQNYQNSGGWGSMALAQLISDGCSTDGTWPMETPGMSDSECNSANMAAIRNGRQYLSGSRAEAAQHKVTSWYDLRPRNLLEKLSLVARRIPVPSGYNWMGHEMCTIDGMIFPNGDLGCIDMDNYGTGGNYNFRAMTSSKGTPDDACAPVVSQANFPQAA